MKFNVNDRVRYTGTILSRVQGEEGFVKGYDRDGNVEIAFDNAGDGFTCYEQSLKLIESSYETAVQEAQRLVHGDRNSSYGHPYEDFTRTAKIWSAILGVEVTAKQAALCMCGVKISREVNKPKRDNLVDLAGYAEVANRIQRYEDGEEPN